MKDFFKISTIFAVMWVMTYIFENNFESSNINILMYFIVQNIVLICLFNTLKLQHNDIIIFCGFITVLLMLMAIDCNIILKDSAEIVSTVKGIIPLQIIEMIVSISKPFFTIFVILNNLNLIVYSIYIVPIYMAALAYTAVHNMRY